MIDARIQEKLVNILIKKTPSKPIKGIEYIIPFLPQNFPLQMTKDYTDFSKFTLEIGSGWGEFTREYAKLNPDQMIIALEKKKKRVVRSARNQKNEEIKNIRWMVCDIEWYFESIFQKESFNKVVINFPDPWPKTRHTKHRFFTKSFLNELLRITKTNAEIEFATDYWPYMESVCDLLENSGDWKNRSGAKVVLTEIPKRPVSFFERVKRMEGENIYFVNFSRIN